MTVKELIELLESSCNLNADVWIVTDSGSLLLNDDDIFQESDGNSVSIDISVASLGYKKEQK